MPSAADYFSSLLPSQANQYRRRILGLDDTGPTPSRTGPILKLPQGVSPSGTQSTPVNPTGVSLNIPNNQTSLPQQPQGGSRVPRSLNRFDPLSMPGFAGPSLRDQMGGNTGTSLAGTPGYGTSSHPYSQILGGDQTPLKAHHGFWDRLKSIGEGALVNAGQYSATHPGASVGELAAAGLSGGIVGGVKPGAIDQQIFQHKQARQMAQRAQEAEIAKTEAEAQRAAHPPQSQARHKVEVQDDSLSDEGINKGDMVWADVNGTPLKDPTTGKHVLAGRAKAPGQERPERNVVNGQIVERQPDGSWKAVYGEAKPAAAKGGLTANEMQQYQRRESQRQANFNAAKQEYDSLVQEEQDAAAKKDAASAEAQRLKALDPTGKNPDIGDAMKAVNAAQAYYASFGNKKRAAQQKMTQYGTPEPAPEPAPGQAPTAAPQYSGRTMTRSNLVRYAKDHGLNVADAQKQVQGMGITIK